MSHPFMTGKVKGCNAGYLRCEVASGPPTLGAKAKSSSGPRACFECFRSTCQVWPSPGALPKRKVYTAAALRHHMIKSGYDFPWRQLT